MFIIDISKTKFLLNAYLLTPARQCGLVLEGRAAHLSKVLNSVPSFCLSESNQCRASTMLSLKRCKNGFSNAGQGQPWDTGTMCLLDNHFAPVHLASFTGLHLNSVQVLQAPRTPRRWGAAKRTSPSAPVNWKLQSYETAR